MKIKAAAAAKNRIQRVFFDMGICYSGTMKFVIQGGKSLEGEIAISGAKNGAFPLIAAAVLTGQDVTLYNIPDITDIHNMLELVRGLGGATDFQNHTVKLHAG